jgi:hypothetical protein
MRSPIESMHAATANADCHAYPRRYLIWNLILMVGYSLLLALIAWGPQSL